MARRKRTISVDGNNHISVDEETSIRQALTMAGFETETMPPSITSGGEIITASDYDRPVPAPTMITNQTDMVKGAPLRNRLLDYEFELISHFVSEFPGKPRSIELDDNYLLIRSFPLPDSHIVDSVDLLFSISAYYAAPPPGLHIPKNTPNRDQIAKHLGGHVFTGTPSVLLNRIPQAYRKHVEQLKDWDWICFHMKDWVWTFNPLNPLASDCLYKFVEAVLVALSGKHR